jgi:hypothetical protein
VVLFSLRYEKNTKTVDEFVEMLHRSNVPEELRQAVAIMQDYAGSTAPERQSDLFGVKGATGLFRQMTGGPQAGSSDLERQACVVPMRWRPPCRGLERGGQHLHPALATSLLRSGPVGQGLSIALLYFPSFSSPPPRRFRPLPIPRVPAHARRTS